MPLIKQTTTMTANGRAYPLAGSQYEYLPFDAAVLFAILVDALGVVNASVFSGSDVLMQNSPVDVLAVANPIIYPDHYAIQDYAAKGERISVDLQEAAAATPIVRTNVMIQPT
jgi:hypothetical protein